MWRGNHIRDFRASIWHSTKKLECKDEFIGYCEPKETYKFRYYMNRLRIGLEREDL